MDYGDFWWIEPLVWLAILVTIQYGANRVVAHLAKKNVAGRSSFAKLIRPPLAVMIWLLGLIYLASMVGAHVGFEIDDRYLMTLRKTVIAGSLAWFFLRWKKGVEQRLIAHPIKKLNPATVQALGRLVTIVVIFITALILMQAFGVNIGPLLAFGGIGAAAIGFAGKDVIANFCTGIMLQINQPFVEGDYVALPEKNLEGHIEKIGWFSTSIRDRDKRAVYLPNGFFSTQILVNFSRMTHRRFRQTVKIPLSEASKVAAISDKVRATFKQIPEVDCQFPIHVFLRNFGDYACEIEIDAYSTITDLEQFNEFQQKLLLQVQADLQTLNIPLAIPTMSWKPIS